MSLAQLGPSLFSFILIKFSSSVIFTIILQSCSWLPNMWVFDFLLLNLQLELLWNYTALKTFPNNDKSTIQICQVKLLVAPLLLPLLVPYFKKYAHRGKGDCSWEVGLFSVQNLQLLAIPFMPIYYSIHPCMPIHDHT